MNKQTFVIAGLSAMLSVLLCIAACTDAVQPDSIKQFDNTLNEAEQEQLDTSIYNDQMDVRKLVQITPHERQIAWQELGFTAFLHFGPNTFTDREWGDGTEPVTTFAPTALDTDQWIASLKAAGFKAAILTAKHHDGFCLWNTQTTYHSVMNDGHNSRKSAKDPDNALTGTPRSQDQQVDVVDLFVKSCAKYGLKAGIYLSPWDRNQGRFGVYGNGTKPDNRVSQANLNLGYGGTKPWSNNPANKEYNDYTDFYIDQLTELLDGRYGEIYSMWMDGAGSGTHDDDFRSGKANLYGNQTYDWPRIFAKVRELQPNCVLTNVGSDAAWIGNEDARVLPSHWSVVPASQAYATYIISQSQQTAGSPPINNKTNPQTGTRENLANQVDLIWNPLEADARNRPNWFFHSDDTPKPMTELLEMYERTVGGNVQLLLNIPPDPTGQLHTDNSDALNDVKILKALGEKIKGIYGIDAFPPAIFQNPATTTVPGYIAAVDTNLLHAPNVTISTNVTDDPAHPITNVLANDDTYWRPKGEKETAIITITLPQATNIARLMLQENIRLSQRIERFKVEIAPANRSYTTVFEPTAQYTYTANGDFNGTVYQVERNVGFKRICTFPPTEAKYIRITIEKSRIYPTLKYIAAYEIP
jgi:alpha-L-fucosidase